MKWLLLIVTLLLAQVASAQDNVTFIHGLNSDADAWSKAASRFESLYDITSKRIEYSSTPTISAIASSHYPSIFDSTIIVAHSIGGLVAREMVRTNPNGKIRALVTVGAPHTGATGAELPGSNRVATMIGRWVYDLARPWILLGWSDPVAREIASTYISYIVGNIAQILTDVIFGGQSVQDMRSTSTFLHTLNGSSGSTFPDAYYTLWSTEDWNMQYRLIDAMDDGVEDGSVMRIAALVTGVYLVSHDLAYGLAGLYYDDWVRTGDLYFYNAHVYWSFVAAAFLDGVHAIGWRWQYDWNVNVVGTSPTSLDSDGLVRTSSQRPSFVREERWIPIPGGVNHFEQRTKQPALDALGRALEMDDIGVSTRIAPLEVSISGPSILSAGEVGTWTAKPSGGESPYAYDWEYQWICSSEADSGGGISLADLPCDTWEDGGGNATFSSSASSGMDGLRLRLTVVDTKEREKTAEHLVEIDSI